MEESDVAALREALAAQQQQIDDLLGQRDASQMRAAMVTANPMREEEEEEEEEEGGEEGAGAAPPLFRQFSAHCAAVRGEAPLNLHQATCFYVLKEDAPRGTKLAFFAASSLLVLLQIVVSHSVFLGTFVQTCVKNNQCTFMEGSYCNIQQMKCKPCQQALEHFGETEEADSNHNYRGATSGMVKLEHTPDAEIELADGSWAKVSDVLVSGWRFDGATIMAGRAVAAHIGDECGFTVGADRCTSGCEGRTWRDLPAGYTAGCQGTEPGSCMNFQADVKQEYAGQEYGTCAQSTPADVAIAYVEAHCRGCRVYKNYTDPTFRCDEDDEICHMCYDSNTRRFNVGGPGALNDNVAAMQSGDWITLFLTSMITAASVAAELRDIKLCQLTASAAAAGRTKETLLWRIALEVLQVFRQSFFLPLLVTLVPHVVVIRGGDSL